ncbi:MAG: AGE family epimerase/isomerase [Saprospiraceae bacterium]|nr:AGE family epimerase/isomerase [Saprospiraceae bacterium]
MSVSMDVSLLQKEMRTELDHLLGWWSKHMVDRQHGGFYGRMDHDGRLYPFADKAIIMQSRILWTFAAAAKQTGEPAYQAMATHAYDFINQRFIDQKYGGVYWMLDFQGEIVNDRKQIYAQAFAIYALAAYYQLTGFPEVLTQALSLFRHIEAHSYDPEYDGYFEAFGRHWEPIADLRLSAKDANEAKTMNTHLHVLEAYSTLYLVSQNQEVGTALKRLIASFMERFTDKETGHLLLFFDERWTVKSKLVSYGHDIEASWLITEAISLFDEPNWQSSAKEWALMLARITAREGLDGDGGLNNEQEEDGKTDTDKHWWPQAEAVIGFWNAWELSREDYFQGLAYDLWDFIQKEIKDVQGGEWVWGRRKDGSLLSAEDKAGPWKAPYHNGRMCIEMIRRLSNSKKLK